MKAANGGARFETTIPARNVAKEYTFRVPLESLERARPFMTGRLRLARSMFSDLFIRTPEGWMLFPTEQKK
jgi:hypothetical protein